MLVEDVMATDLVTCDVDGTVRDAVEEMLKNHVGSVIVTDGGTPTGIVTETDVLHAGYVTEAPFGEIPIRDVHSHPLVTTTPSRTLRSAVRQMADEEVKKLPVVDDMELVGILTMSDVMANYGDIVREIHEIEQPRGHSVLEWAGPRLGGADESGD